jgi:DNA primase
MYDTVEQAVLYFHEQLQYSEEAKLYLKNRQISKETVLQFKIGYCPESTKISYRFRNRIIFPIGDAHGRFVGWTARILNGNTDEAKYINTSDSPIYKKGRLLFPLHMSKESLREKRWGIIVEGQMDAIRLWQSGIHNVVATSGTYLRLEQALLLSRYCERVFTVFDGDSAGETAQVKNRPPLEEAGLKVKSVRLPQGEDPDSFILRNGIDKFMDLLKKEASSVR